MRTSNKEELDAVKAAHSNLVERRAAWAMLEALATKGGDMSDKTEWVLEPILAFVGIGVYSDDWLTGFKKAFAESICRATTAAAARIAELEDERDAAQEELRLCQQDAIELQSEIAKCAALLPVPKYMDLPDGGDVEVSEQLRRMTVDLTGQRDRLREFADLMGWTDELIQREIAITRAVLGTKP